jgi:hypothetical protein
MRGVGPWFSHSGWAIDLLLKKSSPLRAGKPLNVPLASPPAGCAVQRTAVWPLPRPSRQGDHTFRTRGAVDLSPTASVRNPRSPSAETRAPIVAASSAHPWMSSLLSIATAAKTGQNLWPPLVRAPRRIRHEIDLRGMASAIVTAISRLARAREGRMTCLTGRERKRKDNVRCLV